MAEPKIMVLDKVENLLDDGENVIGRLVTDKAGNELKVKKGQGGKLETRWDELDNGIGKAFEFTMRMFKPQGKTESFPFVADFTEVKDKLRIKAVQEATKAMPNEQDTRLRSYALAYAKDLVVSQDIGIRGVAPKDQGIRSLDFTEIDTVFNHFLTVLQGGQDVKTETPEEPKTDDITEILKSEGESEVSWESIRPKLNELYNQKALTMDKMLKQLADLGADISSRNAKTSFESLDPEGKQKFAKIILTAKKEEQ